MANLHSNNDRAPAFPSYNRNNIYNDAVAAHSINPEEMRNPDKSLDSSTASAAAVAANTATGPAPWSKLGGLIATAELAPLVEETPLFVRPLPRAVGIVSPPTSSTPVALPAPTLNTASNHGIAQKKPLTEISAANRVARADIAEKAISEQRVASEKRSAIQDMSVMAPASCASDIGKKAAVTSGKNITGPYAVKVALALYREYVRRSQFGSFDLRMTWRDFIDPRPGSKAYATIIKLKENGGYPGIRDDIFHVEKEDEEATDMDGPRRVRRRGEKCH